MIPVGGESFREDALPMRELRQYHSRIGDKMITYSYKNNPDNKKSWLPAECLCGIWQELQLFQLLANVC